MKKIDSKIIQGYRQFRKEYVHGDNPTMKSLAKEGQKPKIMVVACCDSRVDPALILQCEPGDLFVVRNVANIIPPYELDDAHHGTSAALEFAICSLGVEHLIILGHSQCGGIQALYDKVTLAQNDFITSWVSLVKVDNAHGYSTDDCSKLGLKQSYSNCLTFPWIKNKLVKQELAIHLWFFDIKEGEILAYSHNKNAYQKLDDYFKDHDQIS